MINLWLVTFFVGFAHIHRPAAGHVPHIGCAEYLLDLYGGTPYTTKGQCGVHGGEAQGSPRKMAHALVGHHDMCGDCSRPSLVRPRYRSHYFDR